MKNKFIVIPDVHFGLQRSYIPIDYAKYILDFTKEVVAQFSEHKVIFLGDLKENAGVRSKYELEENRFMESLKDCLIVRGNGKHCYDTIKGGDTLESVNGVDFDVVTIGKVRVGLLGYQKEQEELDRKIQNIKDSVVDILCTHNFIEPTRFGAYIKDVKNLPFLTLAGHNHVQKDLGNAVCLGSLVNTDFTNPSDFAWIYESESDDIIKFPRYKFRKLVWEEGLEVKKESNSVTQLTLPNNRPDLIVKYSDIVENINIEKAQKVETTEVTLVEHESLEEMWSEFEKDEHIRKRGLEVLNAVQ